MSYRVYLLRNTLRQQHSQKHSCAKRYRTVCISADESIPDAIRGRASQRFHFSTDLAGRLSGWQQLIAPCPIAVVRGLISSFFQPISPTAAPFSLLGAPGINPSSGICRRPTRDVISAVLMGLCLAYVCPGTSSTFHLCPAGQWNLARV